MKRVIFLALLFIFTGNELVLAQDKKPSLLEPIINDPLLPKLNANRPLTPLQKEKLKSSLDELNLQAETLWKSNDQKAAFTIWNREIKLRRFLGLSEEILALSRVGKFAGESNNKFEIKLIKERLQSIYNSQAKSELNLEFLQSLATAYQNLQLPLETLSMYQQIFKLYEEENNLVKQEETLKIIGDLQIGLLDYEQAALSYEKLLIYAYNRGDNITHLSYLQQLNYLYEQSANTDNSLQVKLRLLNNYEQQKEQDSKKILELQRAIAAHYNSLKQPEQAIKYYQDAYKLAMSLEQLSNASEILQNMAEIYIEYDNLDYALQLYQIRVQIDQKYNNYYEVMNSYDKIGNIYRQLKKYELAVESWQKGLEMAKELKYNEDYFLEQIKQVTSNNEQ